MNTITVYAGSSGFAPEQHNEAAKTLGLSFANKGIKLCYGGMNAGLMYLVAESCRRNGGEVIGVIPAKLKDSERVHHGLDKLITVDTLWERKREMYYCADAFIALPGGFGTMDEAAEILYWGVLGFHNKPMLFLNIDGYWDSFIACLEKDIRLGSNDKGPVTDFLLVANSVEEAHEKLSSWTAPSYAVSKDDRSEELPHYEDVFANPALKNIIVSEPTACGLYQVGSALTLRQLGKHGHPVGLLNDHGRFDNLLEWISQASKARYITPKCTDLFTSERDMDALNESLESMMRHEIDLHEDKWGDKPDY